jgi:D-3-phosphoglycerate dehydrogenase / 2-oxoglutarate reductase
MTLVRPKLLLACSQQVYNGYVPPDELARLETFADFEWFECNGGKSFGPNEDAAVAEKLRARVGEIDGLLICHGAPTIDAAIMDAAPKLKIIGELEGDRFAGRIDLEAAWARGIRTVDTTNGSSYPVSEWALALTLVAMRNAGAHFRRIISGNTSRDLVERDRAPGRLTGKRVGLIGCGHMGRRLIKLLRPFEVEIWVYDPYLPREMAEALDFLQTSLANVLSQCDVIICLAPLTPGTAGMLGEKEFDLVPSGAVFVNVSRGAVVDSNALVARLKRGDIFAGLDVFDPEPFPPDGEIIHLPNVFLSPHIGYYTGDPYRPFFELMVDEMHRFFNGHETYYDLTPRSKANRTGAKLEK